LKDDKEEGKGREFKKGKESLRDIIDLTAASNSFPPCSNAQNQCPRHGTESMQFAERHDREKHKNEHRLMPAQLAGQRAKKAP